MMDELELLKKDWQKKEAYFPKLSYDEIYKMIWKKSSSIVKWIFYISIIEFLFWIGISFIPLENNSFSNEGTNVFNTIEMGLNIVSFGIIIFFMFKFYKNYKKINAADSAKVLMKKIIVTRKTVMQYVWANLILAAVSFILLLTGVLIDNPSLIQKTEATDNQFIIWIIIIGSSILFILLFGLLLWLIYRLLYGILLKRLNDNYNELKKLEV